MGAVRGNTILSNPSHYKILLYQSKVSECFDEITADEGAREIMSRISLLVVFCLLQNLFSVDVEYSGIGQLNNIIYVSVRHQK